MTAQPPDPSAHEPAEPTKPVEPVKPLPGALAFVGLGTTAAGCVAVGVGCGIALDSWLTTAPLFLVVGLVLGLGAAVAAVVAQVRRYL